MVFPTAFPSFTRLLDRLPGRSPSGSNGGMPTAHGDRAESTYSADSAQHCLGPFLLQPPLPPEPVVTNVPLDATDPDSHVGAAMALLRQTSAVPLADRLATGLPTDRSAAIALLDGLLAEGKRPGPLASSGPLAACEQGRRAIGLAVALRDDLKRAGAADAVRLKQAADALIGALEAIPYGGEQGPLRAGANAALGAIVGGGAWDLVAMINSDRLPDRQAAVAQLDKLLAHVKVLANRASDGSQGGGIPPALRAALHRLVIEAGHALNPAQRAALHRLPTLGTDLEQGLQASAALSGAATDTLLRLCQHAGRCASDNNWHVRDAVLLAEFAALGTSARRLADAAPPSTAASGPADNSAHRRAALLQSALATWIPAWNPEDLAKLHRWLSTPAVLALRTMIQRSARAGEPSEPGSSRATSLRAGQRRLMDDWLVAYDELSAMLAVRMARQADAPAKKKAASTAAKPEAAPRREAGKATVTDTSVVDYGRPGAGPVDGPMNGPMSGPVGGPNSTTSGPAHLTAVTVAQHLFRELFRTEPVPQAEAGSPTDWVRA